MALAKLKNNTLYIKAIDEAYIQIWAETGIMLELREYFTFYANGYQFDRRYRQRQWDGKIRLLSFNGTIYRGLLSKVQQFADERNYRYIVDSKLMFLEELSLQEAKEFALSLNIRNEKDEKITPYDDQIEAFAKAVRNKRRIIVFPTGGGKSLIAYLIVRWLFYKNLINKIAIVVPRTQLVEQFYREWRDYSSENGWSVTLNVHRQYSGKDKETDLPITLTTWHSLYKTGNQNLRTFDAIIGDEAHEFNAKSLITLMTGLSRARFRIGMTGSINNNKVNKLVLEGLFGPAFQLVKAHELIEQKRLAPIKIKAIVLRHPNDVCKAISGSTYQEEIDFLVRNEARNRFIVNLALSLEGNTLILFHLIEKQGEILLDLLQNKTEGTDIPVYYVDGKVDVELREDYRQKIESDTKAKLLASWGTFKMGINIKNLHNIIYASAFKKDTTNKQGLGRGLRLGTSKQSLRAYDITDDLRTVNSKTGKVGKSNHTLNHFKERLAIYKQEKFPFKVYNVKLERSHL